MKKIFISSFFVLLQIFVSEKLIEEIDDKIYGEILDTSTDFITTDPQNKENNNNKVIQIKNKHLDKKYQFCKGKVLVGKSLEKTKYLNWIYYFCDGEKYNIKKIMKRIKIKGYKIRDKVDGEKIILKLEDKNNKCYKMSLSKNENKGEMGKVKFQGYHCMCVELDKKSMENIENEEILDNASDTVTIFCAAKDKNCLTETKKQIKKELQSCIAKDGIGYINVRVVFSANVGKVKEVQINSIKFTGILCEDCAVNYIKAAKYQKIKQDEEELVLDFNLSGDALRKEQKK